MLAYVSGHADTVGNKFAGTSDYIYSFGGNTITSGNLVVIFVETYVRQVSTIAGTNLTLTRLVQSSYNDAIFIGDLWYGIATGSVSSVTVTLGGNTSDDACVAYAEFSGQAADQSSATSNSSVGNNVTSHNSGSVTPPTADNVVVCGMHRTNATWTEDGAFTMVSSADAGCAFGYRLQSSATAQEFNATSDVNRYSVMTIGAFAGTSGGGGTAVPVFTYQLKQQGIA